MIPNDGIGLFSFTVFVVVCESFNGLMVEQDSPKSCGSLGGA